MSINCLEIIGCRSLSLNYVQEMISNIKRAIETGQDEYVKDANNYYKFAKDNDILCKSYEDLTTEEGILKAIACDTPFSMEYMKIVEKNMFKYISDIRDRIECTHAGTPLMGLLDMYLEV